MFKNKILLVCILIAGLMAAGPAWALHEKSSETRIEDLSKRIEILEKKPMEEPSPDLWFNKISISGLLEVEAGYEKYNPDAADEPSEESSDIVLSTFELGLDVDFIDHVGGHVLVLWEEDDTEPIDLDEGYLSLTGTEQTPLYLHAGKLYVPFGNLDTYFISDPLPLELGETRESAILAGYHKDMCNVFCGGFNGDVDKIGDNNHIDSFFAGAEFSLPEDDTRMLNMTAGVSYLSNIADSDGLSEANDIDGDGDPDGIRDYVGGISAYLYLDLVHSVYCVAECVCALDKFNAGELNFGPDNESLRPFAWNFEIAYVTPADIGFGAKYEGSNDCNDFLPERRYGGIVFCSPYENTYLGLEYLYQEFDNDDKNEVVTAQLAFEF
ncbi:MAG: LbtU family siderophore porin [Desulfobacteraceae bacterium]|nr:LbtU family siderophore porin [Desulfobacteraceae bacterium]MBC2756664.1 LbtU family siderophore porin [Desulfobacteraceae bacterium]